MVKKKAATAPVPKPTPKALVFPELSEKKHIQCNTFLEDQVLLLNVCVCLSVRLLCIQILFFRTFSPQQSAELLWTLLTASLWN